MTGTPTAISRLKVYVDGGPSKSRSIACSCGFSDSHDADLRAVLGEIERLTRQTIQADPICDALSAVSDEVG